VEKLQEGEMVQFGRLAARSPPQSMPECEIGEKRSGEKFEAALPPTWAGEMSATTIRAHFQMSVRQKAQIVHLLADLGRSDSKMEAAARTAADYGSSLLPNEPVK